MTHEVTTPLAKLLAAQAKDVRDELQPGEYILDEEITFHLRGGLKVGEDYESRIVAKADPWTLLAAALSHLNGVTVASLVREALTADPELVKSIKDRAKVAMREVKAPTLTECRGKVTLVGTPHLERLERLEGFVTEAV